MWTRTTTAALLGCAVATGALPHAAATPPPRRLMTVPSPCPGPSCELPPDHQPQAVGLRIVYLNFDGVTLEASNANDDAVSNESAILTGAVSSGQSEAIPAFSVDNLASTEGLSREQ